MSSEQLSPSPSLQRLLAEGYDAEIVHQHLLVHSVPYVTTDKEVVTGILATPMAVIEGMGSRPDHTAYFKGSVPCDAGGNPLTRVVNNSDIKELFDGFEVNHYLSNKPTEDPTYPADYYTKLVHYINIFVAHARAIDLDADARTGKARPSRHENPVFKYADTATPRAGIKPASQKLERVEKIAIVGLGGTGAYILDQVAKCPVREIHLFDGDTLKPHNAFRSPGAVPYSVLEDAPKKVDYYRDMYSTLRNGLVANAYYITNENKGELSGYEFVFISVDDGLSRKLITSFLIDKGIPFIDVGMGINLDTATSALFGQCRVTMGTPDKTDHLAKYLPVEDDRDEALYRSNIQVADLNTMNAIIAVTRWKQYCGFYVNHSNPHNISFNVGMQSIVRTETDDCDANED